MEAGDDPYKILQVPKDASEADIKKSYRKLALKHHPDRQSTEQGKAEAQDLFAKIAGAYELLTDTRKRKDYDTSQKEQKKQSGKARGFDHQKVNVTFNDPYEVWKRDFQKQFGFPYPGAQWDFTEQPKKAIGDGRKVRGGGSDSDSSSSDSDSGNDSSSSDSNSQGSSHDESYDDNTQQQQEEDEQPKRRSFLGALVPFGRGKKKEKEAAAAAKAAPSSSTALVPHGDAKKSKSSSTAVTKSGKKSSTALAKSLPSKKRNKDAGGGALVVSNGVEGDNRPISMETITEKVQHPDGTVETITKVRMTRPDGSIETITTTDKAEKRPNWRKPEQEKQPTRLQLTNGEPAKAPPKQLTNGKHSKSTKKPNKVITDGGTSSTALVKAKKSENKSDKKSKKKKSKKKSKD